jgi:HSP20 family protein
MSSTRWDPWGDIVSLREAMNNLLEDSFVSRGRPGGPATPATQGAVGLALDIKEMGEFFEVTASVPGVSPDDVEITVLGDRLRIRGERKEEAEQAADSGRWVLRERRYGAFERTVNLPTAGQAGRGRGRVQGRGANDPAAEGRRGSAADDPGSDGAFGGGHLRPRR